MIDNNQQDSEDFKDFVYYLAKRIDNLRGDLLKISIQFDDGVDNFTYVFPRNRTSVEQMIKDHGIKTGLSVFSQNFYTPLVKFFIDGVNGVLSVTCLDTEISAGVTMSITSEDGDIFDPTLDPEFISNLIESDIRPVDFYILEKA